MTVKHCIYSLLLALTVPAAAHSQTFFQNILGAPDTTEQGLALAVLANGNIAVGGFANGLFNPQDAAVLLLNPAGELIWGKTLDLGVAEQVTDLQLTGDGNLLALLHTTPVSGDPLASFSAVVRLNISTGTVIDIRKFVGAASSLLDLNPVSGGYLLTGSVWPAGADAGLPIAVKINDNLTIAWQTALTDNLLDGGRLRGVWEDPQQEFIFVAGDVSWNGNRDGLLVKFNQAGEANCRRVGSSGEDALVDITAAKNGNLLVAGHSRNFGNGQAEVWVVETDQDFVSLKESKVYGFTQQAGDLFTTDLLALPGDQHLISTGGSGTTLGSFAGLLKLSAGNEVLGDSRDYGNQAEGSGFARLRALPNDAGFVAAGTWFDQLGFNFFVTKTRPDLSVETDCCPKDLLVNARDVIQSVAFETIVPGATQPITIAPAAYLAPNYMPANQSICMPIDLAFSLSDSTICPGGFVDITATGFTPGVTYTFELQNGDADPTLPGRAYFLENGFVTRVGENQFCRKTLAIEVMTANQNNQFANVFTPNGDNLNDTFRPVFTCPIQRSYLRIYNRWGELIFETRNPTEAWDGMVNGQPAASDVYVWYLEYEAERDGVSQKFTEKEQVTLLR